MFHTGPYIADSGTRRTTNPKQRYDNWAEIQKTHKIPWKKKLMYLMKFRGSCFFQALRSELPRKICGEPCSMAVFISCLGSDTNSKWMRTFHPKTSKQGNANGGVGEKSRPCTASKVSHAMLLSPSLVGQSSKGRGRAAQRGPGFCQLAMACQWVFCKVGPCQL